MNVWLNRLAGQQWLRQSQMQFLATESNCNTVHDIVQMERPDTRPLAASGARKSRLSTANCSLGLTPEPHAEEEIRCPLTFSRPPNWVYLVHTTVQTERERGTFS